MSGFDDEIQEFLAERQQADYEAEDDARVLSAAEQKKVHLRSLIAKGGVTGQLASEALVAMEEREAKAERERLAAEAEALAAQRGIDYDDQGVQAALRAQAEQARATADARIRQRERERLMTAGVSPEGVEAALREQEAQRSWFDRDPLLSNPSWQKHEVDQFEAARPQHATRRYGGLEVAAAEAEEEVELMRREQGV
jgi:hypothetical protein